MKRHVLVGATLVAASLVLSGCTGEATPTSSATATATSPEPAPSQTSMPTPTQPTAVPTPSATPAAEWSVPADWKAIPTDEAGIDTSTVKSVVGAWQLPGGGIASIVVVVNDAATTDPKAYYKATFADFASSEDLTVVNEAGTTNNGQPVVIVTATPAGDSAGDAQKFIVALGEDSVTWASLSDSAANIADSGTQLWELMKTLPSS